MKTDTQHTPGPWIADRSAVFNEDRHFICQTDCGFNSPETGDTYANAALIAAAPELLAALQIIHANAGESPEWIRRHTSAVITKATGGQS